MTSTLKATFLLAIISLTGSFAQAQNAGLTHIFPQVVDGVGSDGTVYTSRFLIASSGGSSATCQISLFGIGPERLSARASVLVQGSFFETITTRGEDVIDTGYARLDCSQPVVASLTYSMLSATGTPLGIATVPGAPVASVALIPMVLNGRYRYGIALANDNDAAQLVVLLFDSGTTSLYGPFRCSPGRSTSRLWTKYSTCQPPVWALLELGRFREAGRVISISRRCFSTRVASQTWCRK